jgi:hypothetical protein
VALGPTEPETFGVISDKHVPVSGVDVCGAEVALFDTHFGVSVGEMGMVKVRGESEKSPQRQSRANERWKSWDKSSISTALHIIWQAATPACCVRFRVVFPDFGQG